MRKTRYRPIQSNFPINQVLDKFLGTQLSEFVGGEFTTTTPATNITESEDGYQIDLAVPGLSKKDVVIEVHENTLIVKSEKSSASEDQSFDRREFNYSSFERKFFLGDDIDQENIDAKHKNGILSISLIKDISKAQKKTVEIK